MKKNIIAIIPARGGSKGIPNKNIVNIAGKPLISWTINQCLNSKYISEIYVSTNDDKIANISKNCGAKIIWRPDEISNDTSSSESAILHAIDFFMKNNLDIPDLIVFLQATSPLRKADDIDNAIMKIKSENADSLFSGSKFDDFLFWERDGNELRSVNYDYHNRGRRQDRLPQFVENGSLYIFDTAIFIKNKNRLAGKISIYEMEFWQTWEIDTYEDIELIEFYINNKLKLININLLKSIKLLVYDFDGVMTDNKVNIDQYGNESVSVNRSDGLAIAAIKENLDIPQIIISTEKNSVVQKRAEKLKIPYYQGVENKESVLLSYIQENNVDLKTVAYIGNDINDYAVMSIVGITIAPADASDAIKEISTIITKARGGEGVIRELYELIKVK